MGLFFALKFAYVKSFSYICVMFKKMNVITLGETLGTILGIIVLGTFLYFLCEFMDNMERTRTVTVKSKAKVVPTLEFSVDKHDRTKVDTIYVYKFTKRPE